MFCSYLDEMNICLSKKNISFTICMLHIIENLNDYTRTNRDKQSSIFNTVYQLIVK